MRTSEERVQELHHRMDAMEKTRNRRKDQFINAAAYAVGLVISVLMAFVISGTPMHSPGELAGSAAASMFADHAAFGYIVVALLAFCLGALVTLLCFRIKLHRKEDQENDRRL